MNWEAVSIVDFHSAALRIATTHKVVTNVHVTRRDDDSIVSQKWGSLGFLGARVESPNSKSSEPYCELKGVRSRSRLFMVLVFGWFDQKIHEPSLPWRLMSSCMQSCKVVGGLRKICGRWPWPSLTKRVNLWNVSTCKKRLTSEWESKKSVELGARNNPDFIIESKPKEYSTVLLVSGTVPNRYHQ
jgi:hypothetical protein